MAGRARQQATNPGEASAARTPRQENRQAEILHAATEVFFKSGFAGASVDEIIAKVGGSKRTIYSYFGNKEQLFATVVREIAGRAMAPLAEDDICRADLETTLYDAGRRYIDVVMSPEALQLYRTVVAEGSRFPQLAQVFFESGPGRASSSLARVLRQKSEEWGVSIDDADQLAEHFFGMIRDDLHLQVVLGLRPPPTPAEAESSVRVAVNLFLNGACRRS